MIMDDFIRRLEGPTVVVCVGPTEERRDFKVAKDLLFEKSEWFKNALKDERFVEGQLNIIELPEDTPSVFAAFYYFILHHDELAFEAVCVQHDGIEACCEQLKLCIDLWIFGDKIRMLELQNAAMKRACVIVRECDIRKAAIPAAVLQNCFSKTLPGSPLQVLAADYVVDCMVTEPQKSAQLLSGLATVEGFVTALLKSHVKYHEMNADIAPDSTFPRYLEPYRYREILYDPPARQEKTNPYSYDGRLDESYLKCLDCKQAEDDVELRCANCMKGSTEEKVAAVPLCEDCAFKREMEANATS
ncbi:hypothetical protein AC579_1641 [Pseudocercospora musae]|uniref:BTB domain-containing protein n=1 Tax=Pseudocercospora musae TaxID=113226 RepID=A0A139IAJ5_9PEZI|nr:hypothetical protein AC579_1641 [Pseudocercospora musae]